MAKKHKVKASEVLISVDDDHMDRVADVAHELRAVGLKVSNIHDQLGTITGSIAPSKFHSLKGIAGVAGVEEAGSYQIAPPDSDLQ